MNDGNQLHVKNRRINNIEMKTSRLQLFQCSFLVCLFVNLLNSLNCTQCACIELRGEQNHNISSTRIVFLLLAFRISSNKQPFQVFGVLITYVSFNCEREHKLAFIVSYTFVRLCHQLKWISFSVAYRMCITWCVLIQFLHRFKRPN